MRNRVNELLEMMGLNINTVQVFEGTGHNNSIYFPNFMTTTEIQDWATDKELVDTILSMMEEHAMDVANSIKLVRRYQKSVV